MCCLLCFQAFLSGIWLGWSVPLLHCMLSPTFCHQLANSVFDIKQVCLVQLCLILSQQSCARAHRTLLPPISSLC